MLAYRLCLSLSCPGCGESSPLDAVAPSVHCRDCGQDTAIGLPAWAQAFESAVVQALSGDPDVLLDAGTEEEDIEMTGTAVPTAPACTCLEPLSEAQLAAVPPAQPWLRHTCGRTLMVRSFAELESIAFVVGESSPSAPSPPGTGFVVVLRGALAARVAKGDTFIEVAGAVADARGAIYCVGSFPGTLARNHGFYPGPEGSGDRLYVQYAWTYEPGSFAVRWRREALADRVALLSPELLQVTGEGLGGSIVLSTADGLPCTPEPGRFPEGRQVLRDADGTWIVASADDVHRIDPAQGGKTVPLFAVEGFFARLASSDALSCTWGAAIALASDGDLVIHHANIGEKPCTLSRFDRHGHRKVVGPSPLGETFGHGVRLVSGPGGIVWARGDKRLCAVTPTAMVPVNLPDGGAGLAPTMVVLPDGSLVLFGKEGRILRLTTDGPAITGVQAIG